MESTLSQKLLAYTILTTAYFGRATLADVSSCPGVFAIPSAGMTGCCVGGTLAAPTLSSCAGWPRCTGSATVTPTTQPLSCATWIPASESNYFDLVSSASSSLAASGTKYETTLGSGGSDTTVSPASGSNTASAVQATSSSGAMVVLHSNDGALHAILSLVAAFLGSVLLL